MSGPSGERCGFCYFLADPEASYEALGWCKRYPPPYAADEDRKKPPPWPPLASITSWCGEFKLHPNMQDLMMKALIKKEISSHEDEAE